MEVITYEEKEGFGNYLSRWREKVTTMMDRPSEANQVRLFIGHLQPAYKQQLWFIPFEKFLTLMNVWMQLEEELVRETPVKTIWKSNRQNKEKKVGDSSNKEVMQKITT